MTGAAGELGEVRVGVARARARAGTASKVLSHDLLQRPAGQRRLPAVAQADGQPERIDSFVVGQERRSSMVELQRFAVGGSYVRSIAAACASGTTSWS
jgi:hypothetical protein